MKVLLTKSFFPEDIAYISSRIEKGISLITPPDYKEESVVALAPEADVLFGGMNTEKLLAAAKRIKFLQIPWTGVDNLDFGLLARYNATVCNSHSNSTVVAEHALALMMDAAKKLSYHDRMLRQGNWNRPKPDQSNEISPFSGMISGSKVAIIGFGAIGRKIHSLLKGFNCSFKVFTKDQVNLNDFDTHIKVFSPGEVSDEIKDVNYVFVCVPLTPETKQLINAEFISAMNTNSILINISRGEVLHESDLFDALKTKSIAFASIDTWFNYPSKDSPVVFPSAKHEYHMLDNLVLSPHRAGFVEGSFPHLDDAIENLNRCYQGKELINVISLTDKY